AGRVAGKFPHELSGGQRQRVGFAAALAGKPKLIVADEPVSMLDVSIRIGVLNLMSELREREGLSFLYITHDVASARYVADRVLVLYAGHLVEEGPAEDVLQRPKHPYTQLLLSAVPDPRAALGISDAAGGAGVAPRAPRRDPGGRPSLRRAGSVGAPARRPRLVRCGRDVRRLRLRPRGRLDRPARLGLAQRLLRGRGRLLELRRRGPLT